MSNRKKATTRSRRPRIRIIWHKRNEIERSVVVQDSIHVQNLLETLRKAPKVTVAVSYEMKKGERCK